MQLPGGLIETGVRRRDFAFRPLCGALELALAELAEAAGATEAGAAAPSTPQVVTRALTLALDQLAGGEPSASRVAQLCVADRQFLMRALDVHLGHGEGWFDAHCARCGARFDFHLDYAQLPVVEAGGSFPYVTLDLDGSARRFRLPTGADQEALAVQPDAQARSWLLRALEVDGEASGDCDAAVDGFEAALDASLDASLDLALEAVAPAIVLTVEAACPECGHANAVELDPYRALALRSDDLLREVHEIAEHYHWSEREILGLPRRRRLHYLQLIAGERGLAS